jgi:gamma-glutamyltranspeptidase/glutathione hydrolase
MPLLPTDAADLHRQPFPSRRSAVLGRGPMVATSQPLAALAGLRMLLDGGHAVDAAVATAAALAVVEPTGTGLGGDCFAMVFLASGGRVLALNGSGRSPRGLSIDALERRGLTSIPMRGILSVTVPGAVDAWATLHRALGRLPWPRLLDPAIVLAEQGYPVSELIAGAWQNAAPLLAGHAAARRHFLPNGRAPRAGEIVRLPALGHTLRRIAEGGAAAFYHGPVAADIVATSEAAAGLMAPADLADHTSTWVEPLATEYRGAQVWECPPNSQGLAALLGLGILRGFDLSRLRWGSAEHLHLQIEAMRLAFADARAWVGDPTLTPPPVAALLDEAHLIERRSLIGRQAMARVGPGLIRGGDTVYLAVVDAEGNACSLINSNYMGFGSGIVTHESGIPLQNRGAGFVLEPGHPNTLAPAKRPYHTLIPAMATRRVDGSLLACFGLMGGFMQPQGHLQMISNLLDFGLDPQRALDAPRFQLLDGDRVALEPAFATSVRRALSRRGHRLVPRNEAPPAAHFGGGQVIVVTEDGVRVGGSDPRKDGLCVAG